MHNGPDNTSRSTDQSRYIPLSVRETIELCTRLIVDEQRLGLQKFSALLSAWFHHQFLTHSQLLESAYQADTSAFAEQLDLLVQAANFERITQTDLLAALKEESIFQLRVEVDFTEFQEVVFYRRGPSLHRVNVKRWFGLRRQEIEFTNYELVLVYVRFHNAGEPRLLKLFKNVPKADLEMLFPNTQVRMRLLDKFLIGIPAFISGMAMLTTKLGATLILLGGAAGFWLGFNSEPVILDQKALIALVTAAGALGGYLWKQYSNFKNRKIRFMKTLTENLYFKTVADNEGVISYLLDRAEQSETKEALLAFTALSVNGSMTAREIGQWVESKIDHVLQFDTEDALNKLLALSLVNEDASSNHEETAFTAVTIKQAYGLIDQRWDDLFTTPTSS